MKKHGFIIFIPVVALAFCVFRTTAQEMPIPGNVLENKFFETRKISDALVKNYAWDSRTDVTREGKVMDILIEHFWYKGDGAPESKIINDQEAKLPSTFLIHQVAEDIKQEMMNFMNGLHSFLQEYALGGEKELNTFFSKAIIGNPDPGGEILVAGNNIIINGDKMIWYIDTKNFTLSRASISTIFQGEKVEFTASYKYIIPGVNYLAFAEILVPGKSIIVQLHNYDYTKTE